MSNSRETWRNVPPSFGIVSRDCYDANLLAALRKAQARAEAAKARVRELEEALEPFAAIATALDNGTVAGGYVIPDDEVVARGGAGEIWFRVRDLRRARRARSPSLKEQP